MIENLDNEPIGHWDDINNIVARLTCHHKKAIIIIMKDKSIGK